MGGGPRYWQWINAIDCFIKKTLRINVNFSEAMCLWDCLSHRHLVDKKPIEGLWTQAVVCLVTDCGHRWVWYNNICLLTSGVRPGQCQQATANDYHRQAVGSAETSLQRESQACPTCTRTAQCWDRTWHAGRPGIPCCVSCHSPFLFIHVRMCQLVFKRFLVTKYE